MEFLETNLQQEEDKKSFARILKGNKLLYKEANAFIETLLKALTIEDGRVDTILAALAKAWLPNSFV